MKHNIRVTVSTGRYNFLNPVDEQQMVSIFHPIIEEFQTSHDGRTTGFFSLSLKPGSVEEGWRWDTLVLEALEAWEKMRWFESDTQAIKAFHARLREDEALVDSFALAWAEANIASARRKADALAREIEEYERVIACRVEDAFAAEEVRS